MFKTICRIEQNIRFSLHDDIIVLYHDPVNQKGFYIEVRPEINKFYPYRLLNQVFRSNSTLPISLPFGIASLITQKLFASSQALNLSYTSTPL